jgi:hypothetical protein
VCRTSRTNLLNHQALLQEVSTMTGWLGLRMIRAMRKHLCSLSRAATLSLQCTWSAAEPPSEVHAEHPRRRLVLCWRFQLAVDESCFRPFSCIAAACLCHCQRQVSRTGAPANHGHRHCTRFTLQRAFRGALSPPASVTVVTGATRLGTMALAHEHRCCNCRSAPALGCAKQIFWKSRCQH